MTIGNPRRGSEGNPSLRVALTTQRYSGVTLKYFQGNWETYDRFQFRVYNPSSGSLSLTCRIHDDIHAQDAQDFHDRFNRTFDLPMGWSTVTIPLKEIKAAPATRQMDLRRIRGVRLFAFRLPHPRIIYIDDLKLL